MLDLSRLNSITKGDKSLMKKFLKLFVDNTSTDLNRLRQALDIDDRDKVFFFVHKIKSSTYSIGFLNGHKELQRIEDQLLLSSPLTPLRGALYNVTKECELAVLEARKLLEAHIE